jgi:hypothetical protein
MELPQDGGNTKFFRISTVVGEKIVGNTKFSCVAVFGVNKFDHNSVNVYNFLNV